MTRENGIGASGLVEDFNFVRPEPDSIRVICRIASEAGFLDGVEVMPLANGPTRGEFLLTVAVEEDLVLASNRFTWSELEPPVGVRGAEAIRHVLGRIDEIARRTRAGLNAYTWLRASEREQLLILGQARES
ncbi:hypothetical protein [Streptomyces sp. NPDC001508]|uniref:hypothetical protein n=1 Tax=Streptomyces sp. NPDC001508 TaxID=3154656 RepID=UPI00332EF495